MAQSPRRPAVARRLVQRDASRGVAIVDGNASESEHGGETDEAAAREFVPRPPVVIDWGVFPQRSGDFAEHTRGEPGTAEARGFDPRAVMALAVLDRLRGTRGVYVAPNLPDRVVAAACHTYLTLGRDEVLLAIVDPSAGADPRRGFAFTSRRLCWYDRETAGVGSVSGAGNESGSLDAGLPLGVSLEFARVPDTVRVASRVFPEIKLADGWVLPTRGIEFSTMQRLVEVIRVLSRASVSGDFASAASPQAIEHARRNLVSVGGQSETIRRNLGEYRSFHDLARAATPRVLVTPLIIATCLIVYMMMSLLQGALSDPNVDTLYRWGGVSGVSIVLDREYGRLLTGMFLHGGLLHLALNMWCLGRLGPLIERLYGNIGFALLYLLSGLGGGLASTWWHPLVVAVGASGAIFGILGGLLAFLTLQRHSIPASIFGPLRSSTLSFVVFNAGYGLLSTQIDNAAHLGGLASGFLAGTLLSRPWPARGPSDGLVRQAVRMIPLLLLLGVVIVVVVDRVRKSSEVVETLRAVDAPRVAYNEFMKSLEPSMLQFDAVNQRLDDLLRHQASAPLSDESQTRELDRLIVAAERGRADVRNVVVLDSELAGARSNLLSAQQDLISALEALKAAIQSGDPRWIEGEGVGYKALMSKLQKNVESFHGRCREYLRKHGLVRVP